MKLKLFSIFLFTTVAMSTTLASTTDWPTVWQERPFYVGVALGWGCTDWSQLVAQWKTEMDYNTLTLSAPTSAGDTGFAYGFMMGYEVSPHFALETNYMRFPNTLITFDQYSLYAYEDNVTSINSNTYVYNIVGKFMVQVAHTGLRGFANAGGALTHRQDPLVDAGHITPTFGVGLDYVISKRIMTELVFQYYAGFGKAVLRPVLNYIPFLYTVHFKIGYRF